MRAELFNFFYMNGYGWYIWISYSSVLLLLAIQWFIPWRRLKKLHSTHE
jgi:heme exporter protein CcmD